MSQILGCPRVPQENRKFESFVNDVRFDMRAFAYGKKKTPATDKFNKNLSSYTMRRHKGFSRKGHTNKMSFHSPESDGTVQRRCQENFTIPNFYWLNTEKQTENRFHKLRQQTHFSASKKQKYRAVSCKVSVCPVIVKSFSETWMKQDALYYLVILCT